MGVEAMSCWPVLAIILLLSALIYGQCRTLPVGDPFITPDSVTLKFPVDLSMSGLRVYSYQDLLDVNGDYCPQFKNVKVYDDSGRVVNYQAESNMNSTFHVLNKRRYAYEGDRVTEVFDTIMNDYFSTNSHSMFSYKDSGFCTVIEKYLGFGDRRVFSGTRYRFAYDAFGRLQECLQTDSTEAQSDILHNTTYAYEANGCVSEIRERFQQNEFSPWQDMRRELWSNRADTTVTCTRTHSFSVSLKRLRIAQNWMSQDNAWQKTWKRVYTVDASGKAYYYEYYQPRDPDQWTLCGTACFAFDRHGAYLGTSNCDEWLISYDSLDRVKQILSGGWGQNRRTYLYIPVKAIGVESPSVISPAVLFSASPNPFSAGTLVRLMIGRKAGVSLNIHDMQGRLVRTLVSGEQKQIPCSVLWDGRDDGGKPLASGIYLARLTSRGLDKTVKLQLLR
jgi:hypothetical protein